MPDSRSCPVCRGLDKKILHDQRFYEGALGGGYRVVVCSYCGAGFADGIPLQSELDRYYTEQSKYTYDGSGGNASEYDMRRFETVVNHVAPYITRNCRILDIGCATGGLISAFRRHGFENIIGADPSPACGSIARMLNDIDVRTATLTQIASWTEKFDLVLMIGVLEHLRDVREAVDIVKRILSPNGLFYVAVPDVAGLACCRNAPFQQFSMEHINFFSLKSLKNLTRRADFAVSKLWQERIEWSQGIIEPILAGLFAARRESEDEFDDITENSIIEYVKWSKDYDTEFQNTIQSLVLKGEPILVWGTGALTRRLLNDSNLAEAKIIGFVDSRRQAQGCALAGKKIFSPAELTLHPEPILVCSLAFEAEIVETISQMGLPNRIIKLCSYN